MRTTKHIDYVCPISGPCYYTLEFDNPHYYFKRQVNGRDYLVHGSDAFLPSKYQRNKFGIEKLDSAILPNTYYLTIPLISDVAVEDDFKAFEDFLYGVGSAFIPPSYLPPGAIS